jgi:hypothetical protein
MTGALEKRAAVKRRTAVWFWRGIAVVVWSTPVAVLLFLVWLLWRHSWASP